MKPSNLQVMCGAKSGGKRKMRIRYTHIESYGVRFFMGSFFRMHLCYEFIREKERTQLWKKDYLLLNA